MFWIANQIFCGLFKFVPSLLVGKGKQPSKEFCNGVNVKSKGDPFVGNLLENNNLERQFGFIFVVT